MRSGAKVCQSCRSRQELSNEMTRTNREEYTIFRRRNSQRKAAALNMWKLNQTLSGSFSAVSKPNFASKYSLESSWRDLQDLHAFAPLRPQYFSKFSSNFLAFSKLDILKSLNFFKFRRDFHWFSWNLLGYPQIFLKNAATTRNFSISI